MSRNLTIPILFMSATLTTQATALWSSYGTNPMAGIATFHRFAPNNRVPESLWPLNTALNMAPKPSTIISYAKPTFLKPHNPAKFSQNTGNFLWNSYSGVVQSPDSPNRRSPIETLRQLISAALARATKHVLPRPICPPRDFWA